MSGNILFLCFGLISQSKIVMRCCPILSLQKEGDPLGGFAGRECRCGMIECIEIGRRPESVEGLKGSAEHQSMFILDLGTFLQRVAKRGDVLSRKTSLLERKGSAAIGRVAEGVGSGDVPFLIDSGLALDVPFGRVPMVVATEACGIAASEIVLVVIA